MTPFPIRDRLSVRRNPPDWKGATMAKPVSPPVIHLTVYYRDDTLDPCAVGAGFTGIDADKSALTQRRVIERKNKVELPHRYTVEVPITLSFDTRQRGKK